MSLEVLLGSRDEKMKQNSEKIMGEVNKKPRYTEVDGVRLPVTCIPEVVREAMYFKPDKEDVVIITYPKCGTTWVQQIVSLLQNQGKPFTTAEEYFRMLPFLEFTSTRYLNMMKKPRCIKTHLAFDRLNFSKEAKYIYVARNPADCVVSFYHHTKLFPIYFFTNGTFDDFFELFIKGELDWNDYFDHLLSWYERRNEPNVLFLSFESIKNDTRNAILKIAHFMGEDYQRLVDENEGEVLDTIVKYSSMDFMKSTVSEFWNESFLKNPTEELEAMIPERLKYVEVLREAFQKGHKPVGDFVRNGMVGQGKVALSKEQVEKLEKRMLEKTSHCDVMNALKSD